MPYFERELFTGYENRMVEVNESDDAKDKSIAIVIHGLGSSCNNRKNSYGNIIDHLNSKFKVFTFDYLTINQTISTSARILSTEIEKLKEKYEDKKIYIFAHSMGGLVTRSALVTEHAGVDFLLMAGTPNSGSSKVSIAAFARYCFFMCTNQTIKYRDYYDLMLGKHLGLKSLGNKTDCVRQLNNSDIGNEDKYYCMSGRLDFIVPKRNVTWINKKSLPKSNIVRGKWHHLNYFNGELEKSVGRLLSSYENATVVRI